MNVDIYIREVDGSKEIRIPILPDTITAKRGETDFVSFSVMNRGEVVAPTGVGLAQFSFESEFPGKYRKDSSMQRGKWKSPASYNNQIESWKKSGTRLNIMVTGFPINSDVYIQSYTGNPSGGFGDLVYELSLIEARDITIKTTKVKKSTSSTKRTSKSSSTYTIKKGDTLWGIAKKFYGSGLKWEIIYNANKEIIEQTAKKYGYSSSNNGWWIFPGVTLKIPDATTATTSSKTTTTEEKSTSSVSSSKLVKAKQNLKYKQFTLN